MPCLHGVAHASSPARVAAGSPSPPVTNWVGFGQVMLHPGLSLSCAPFVTGAEGIYGSLELVWGELTKPGVQTRTIFGGH